MPELPLSFSVSCRVDILRSWRLSIVIWSPCYDNAWVAAQRHTYVSSMVTLARPKHTNGGGAVFSRRPLALTAGKDFKLGKQSFITGHAPSMPVSLSLTHTYSLSPLSVCNDVSSTLTHSQIHTRSSTPKSRQNKESFALLLCFHLPFLFLLSLIDCFCMQQQTVPAWPENRPHLQVLIWRHFSLPRIITVNANCPWPTRVYIVYTMPYIHPSIYIYIYMWPYIHLYPRLHFHHNFAYIFCVHMQIWFIFFPYLFKRTALSVACRIDICSIYAFYARSPQQIEVYGFYL